MDSRTSPPVVDTPSAITAAQALQRLTSWHEQFLYRVFLAQWYLPQHRGEWDMAHLLASPSYGLLEYLWWSRKYRLTALGMAVVILLSSARR